MAIARLISSNIGVGLVSALATYFVAALLAGMFVALPAQSVPAANTVTIGTTTPTTNIIESYQPVASPITSLRIQRYNDGTGGSGGASGQSFPLNTASSVAAITLAFSAVVTNDNAMKGRYE